MTCQWRIPPLRKKIYHPCRRSLEQNLQIKHPIEITSLELDTSVDLKNFDRRESLFGVKNMRDDFLLHGGTGHGSVKVSRKYI